MFLLFSNCRFSSLCLWLCHWLKNLSKCADKHVCIISKIGRYNQLTDANNNPMWHTAFTDWLYFKPCDVRHDWPYTDKSLNCTFDEIAPHWIINGKSQFFKVKCTIFKLWNFWRNKSEGKKNKKKAKKEKMRKKQKKNEKMGKKTDEKRKKWGKNRSENEKMGKNRRKTKKKLKRRKTKRRKIYHWNFTIGRSLASIDHLHVRLDQNTVNYCRKFKRICHDKFNSTGNQMKVKISLLLRESHKFVR